MTKKTEKTKGDVAIALCDCAGTLRDKIDYKQLSKQLGSMPEVAVIELCSKFCQQDNCTKTVKSLFQKKNKTKRLVIGACDRNIYDVSLRQAIRNVDLNEGFMWSVNIREHCGWVAKESTKKAKESLIAAIRRVKEASPVKSTKVNVNQNVLILGSSVAAIQTATALAQLGHKVTLIEKSDNLGGSIAKSPELYAYVNCDSSHASLLVKGRINELIKQVKSNKQILIQTSSYIKSLNGEFGNFSAVIKSNSSEKKLSAGAIVIVPDSEQSALVELIKNCKDTHQRIAVIMDFVNEQGKRITAQVLSAAEMLAKSFDAEVKIFCRNIRVAATGIEALYRRTRQAGVVIMKYDSPPKISDKGPKKVISIEDPPIGSRIEEEFDLVITADSPTPNNTELLNLIEGLHQDPSGNLQANNVWLMPTKSNREGIFIVGSAPDTDELRDAQTDGLATADEIHKLLKNKQIEVLDDAAIVDTDKCVLCLTCMRICPHAAISIDIDNKAALVSTVSCQRCGMCAAECPAGAIQLPRYTDKEIKAELGEKPRIAVFACENSAFPAATAAAINGSQWQQDIQLIRVPCAGKVDPRDVLKTMESGAQKVMIFGCHLENCQYLSGSTRAAKRIERMNNALEKAGVNKEKVIFKQLASVEPHKFLEYVSENGA